MNTGRLSVMLQCGGFVIALVMGTTATAAEENATELAKKAQNPIADMVSLPFQ